MAMAHFAKIDGDGIVTEVIVVSNDDCPTEADGIAFCRSLFGVDTRWVQTSYNGRIRKNYAGIGYQYDEARDAFIPPMPVPGCTLNEEFCQWEPPDDPGEV